MILRIAEPPGNKVTRKFIDSQDLRQDLCRRLKAAALRKIDEFTYWEEQTDIAEDDSDLRLENKEHKKCTVSSGHTTVLAELITKPFYIRMDYKGKMYSAHVNKNGTISSELSGMHIKKWQRVKDMLFLHHHVLQKPLPEFHLMAGGLGTLGPAMADGLNWMN